MTLFYFIMGITAVVTIIVLLGFFGPVSSEKPFWVGLRKVRAVLDKISYWIICAIAIGCIALVVTNIILKLFQ
jgi:uncharacterized membrane protein YuzA (DUF378 family)